MLITHTWSRRCQRGYLNKNDLVEQERATHHLHDEARENLRKETQDLEKTNNELAKKLKKLGDLEKSAAEAIAKKHSELELVEGIARDNYTAVQVRERYVKKAEGFVT